MVLSKLVTDCAYRIHTHGKPQPNKAGRVSQAFWQIEESGMALWFVINRSIYSEIFQEEMNIMKIKICFAIILGLIVIGSF